MAPRDNRYKQLEFYMTCALILDLLLFIFFLISAGNGVIWLKVILTILIIALSGFCLWLLYASKELLRPRSLWMSVAAAAIVVCTLFALLVNYPSPNPHKDTETVYTSITTRY